MRKKVKCRKYYRTEEVYIVFKIIAIPIKGLVWYQGTIRVTYFFEILWMNNYKVELYKGYICLSGTRVKNITNDIETCEVQEVNKFLYETVLS